MVQGFGRSRWDGMAASQGCVRVRLTAALAAPQVAKLGGQLGRLFTVLDGIYLFKLSQMLPMPPFSYGCAPAPMPCSPPGTGAFSPYTPSRVLGAPECPGVAKLGFPVGKLIFQKSLLAYAEQQMNLACHIYFHSLKNMSKKV